MARYNHLLSCYKRCSEHRQGEISLEFSSIWCLNDVFCSGSFLLPLWKMNPNLTLINPTKGLG
jgi:hypothetical protein